MMRCEVLTPLVPGIDGLCPVPPSSPPSSSPSTCGSHDGVVDKSILRGPVNVSTQRNGRTYPCLPLRINYKTGFNYHFYIYVRCCQLRCVFFRQTKLCLARQILVEREKK